jgi:hypothetical protein
MVLRVQSEYVVGQAFLWNLSFGEPKLFAGLLPVKSASFINHARDGETGHTTANKLRSACRGGS